MKQTKKLNKAALRKMKKNELVSMAEKLQQPIKKTMLKPELIELILKKDQATPLKMKKAAPATKKTAGKKVKKQIRVEDPISTPQPKVETDEALISASKFYGGPQHQPVQAEENGLPETYGRNMIVMLVRDPYWSYLYWELDNNHVSMEKKKLQDPDSAKMVLRIYDITEVEFNGFNSRRTWDIHLIGGPNNWYAHLGIPGGDYFTEIGLIDRHDTFVPLARSNQVQTPRDEMCELCDEEWMTVSEDFHSKYYAASEFDYGSFFSQYQDMLAKRWRFDLTSFVSGSYPFGWHN